MKNKLIENIQDKPKAILVGASRDGKEEILKSLEELERLAETANIETLDYFYQTIKEITKATYIGSGKVIELKDFVNEKGADLIIFDEELSSFQLNNLEDICGVKVIDRSMLILDIFASRAKTSEGKLQVKLAQLKYTLPRSLAMNNSYGRFGGGVGMRGPGESEIELQKRIIKENILDIEAKIKTLKNQREVLRKKRKDSKEKLVAIVGYTNAGKSTLLNTMTKADVYADDKLFATLDTTTRKIFVSYDKRFLITDTVGFVSKLPHEFIEAFQATLEEANSADLILNVVDSSDKHYKEHLKVTNEVLEKIGAGNIPKLVVYNKVDQCQDSEILDDDNKIKISAKKNQSIDDLKQKIVGMLFED
ncbi:MAG: GTPase HflX [Clostridia bacterium]|nr:GTPase HflX [Clostridia bacterium]